MAKTQKRKTKVLLSKKNNQKLKNRELYQNLNAYIFIVKKCLKKERWH
jgi:hypothetical protein